MRNKKNQEAWYYSLIKAGDIYSDLGMYANGNASHAGTCKASNLQV